MKITLYVKKSDPHPQMAQVLNELMMPFELCFKEEQPESCRHLAMTESPVLVVNERRSFVAPGLPPEVFKLLVQSCVEAAEEDADAMNRSD